MKNFELQALRKIFMLDVSEAAEFIGKVSARTWQRWEDDTYKIPTDVIAEMEILMHIRQDMIRELDVDHDELPSFKYYRHFEDYKIDYPENTVVDWRLWQSVISQAYSEELVQLN